MLVTLPSTGLRLSELESAALLAVAGDARDRERRAWIYCDTLLERGHTLETLAGMEAPGWLVAWDLPDGRALALTPWAAEGLGLVMDERMEGGGAVVEEVPYWRACDRDARTGLDILPHSPIHLRRRARTYELLLPDRVPDPVSGPLYVLDFETGETTTDPGKAMKVQGVPVLVDKRAVQKASREAQRLAKAREAALARKAEGRCACRGKKGRGCR